jgi:hypothetical protein
MQPSPCVVRNRKWLLTIATPVLLPIVASQSLPLGATLWFVVVGIASTVAGVSGLRAKPWAYWLLFATFLVQCAEYFSQGFPFSFIGPLSLKFGWVWVSPPSRFNLNVLAIVVCVLSARIALRLGASPRSSISVRSATQELRREA